VSRKTSLLSGYPDHYRAEFRLVVLKAINDDPGKNMTDTRLYMLVLEFGFKVSREFLVNELRWLEEQSAVRLREVGTAVLAELCQAGSDHLERITFITGVLKPSLPR